MTGISLVGSTTDEQSQKIHLPQWLTSNSALKDLSHESSLRIRGFSRVPKPIIFIVTILVLLLWTFYQFSVLFIDWPHHPTSFSDDSRRCDPHELNGRLVVDIQDPVSTAWIPYSSSCFPERLATSLLPSHPTGPSETLPTGRNNFILLLGDSIDRNNIEYTCSLLHGNLIVIGPSHPAFPQHEVYNDGHGTDGWSPSWTTERSWSRICEISRSRKNNEIFNLTILSVFHYGLDEESYFSWKDQFVPPSLLEDRLANIAQPIIDTLGLPDPDFVELGTGLWDLARWGRQDDEKATLMLREGVSREDLPDSRKLEDHRLAWFRTRLESVIEAIFTTFPNLPSGHLLLRKLHQSTGGVGHGFQDWWQPGGDFEVHQEYFSPWRVRDLAELTEDVVASSAEKTTAGKDAKRVEIDRWGDLIFGAPDLFEPGNPHPHQASTMVWIEMMLYRLQKSFY